MLYFFNTAISIWISVYLAGDTPSAKCSSVAVQTTNWNLRCRLCFCIHTGKDSYWWTQKKKPFCTNQNVTQICPALSRVPCHRSDVKDGCDEDVTSLAVQPDASSSSEVSRRTNQAGHIVHQLSANRLRHTYKNHKPALEQLNHHIGKKTLFLKRYSSELVSVWMREFLFSRWCICPIMSKPCLSSPALLWLTGFLMAHIAPYIFLFDM